MFPEPGQFEIGLLRAFSPAKSAIDALAQYITESFDGINVEAIAAQ